MSRLTRLVPFAALAIGLALAAPAARSEDNKPPAGFVALFNGQNLDGWEGHTTMPERAKYPAGVLAELKKKRTEAAHEHWSVKDGAIVFDSKQSTKWVVEGDRVVQGKGTMGISLVTAKDYGDFELLIDWKIAKKGDSGLYLRGQPQIQIWDSDNLAESLKDDWHTGSGGLWNNPLPPDAAKSTDTALKIKAGQKIGKVPLKKADKPVGEWNTFHIVVQGDDVTVKLNGELVVEKAKLLNFWDRGKPVPEKGPIELQYHGDPLWFKNIYVKELK